MTIPAVSGGVNVTAIHHISLLVADVACARRFYSDVLGFVVDEQRPAMRFDGLWLNVNERQQIHLLCLPNPDAGIERPAHGGRDRHAAFSVVDLDALIQQLKKHDVPYTLSQSGRRALFCRDPDDNALEFMGELSE